MRYKIVKKSDIYNHQVSTHYYVMYEKKLWWRKEPIWKYCREETWASYGSWRGVPVKRESLSEAEDWIKLQMKINNGDFKDEDIKIYECRDSKLDKILK